MQLLSKQTRVSGVWEQQFLDSWRLLKPRMKTKLLLKTGIARQDKLDQRLARSLKYVARISGRIRFMWTCMRHVAVMCGTCRSLHRARPVKITNFSSNKNKNFINKIDYLLYVNALFEPITNLNSILPFNFVHAWNYPHISGDNSHGPCHAQPQQAVRGGGNTSWIVYTEPQTRIIF